MSFIALNNVTVAFGKNPSSVLPLLDANMPREAIYEKTDHFVAVKNASLAVEQGEIFVLMGLSGSGKSSLLRCINGLNTPIRGTVSLAGEPIHHKNSQTLLDIRTRRISMVFQRFALMPWLNVIDNVALGLRFQNKNIKERHEIAEKNIILVGLSGFEKRFPHELSGGMQQRVGLARALATGADILLMDEPFSALDPVIRTELQDELLRLQRELQKTIVFVSHDLDEAVRIGNRMAIMENGEIVQIGQPKYILTNPANDYVKRFVTRTDRYCAKCGDSV